MGDGSSASSSTLLAGPVGLDVSMMGQCCLCKEMEPRSQLTEWSTGLLIDAACKNGYKRHMERCGNNPAMKADWKAKSPEDKVAHWVAHKKVYKPYARLGSGKRLYEEGTSDKTLNDLKSGWRFDPELEWCLHQCELGECGEGSRKQQMLIAKGKWFEALTKKGTRTLFKNGQWHIGRYVGVGLNVTERQSSSRTWKRAKSVDDPLNLEGAKQQEAEQAALMKSRLDAAVAFASKDITPTALPEDFDATMITSPKKPADEQESIRDVTTQDTALELRRESKLKALEEQQDFEAEQSRQNLVQQQKT